MIEYSTTQCVMFPEIFAKPAVLQFDQRNGSSDGGAILLKAADRRYGLIRASRRMSARQAASRQGRSLLARVVWRSACSRSPAAIQTPTTRPACLPTRFTRCCSTAIRSQGVIWLRSQPCRALKTPFGRGNSIVWAKHWPTA